METAKVLVRTIARIFYDVEQIVVIDALVNHGAISAADLSLVMDEGKNHKKVQKYCAKLREGGLVSVYVRSETREGAQKPTNKEYYYIDYRKAVDSTKYRIHMLDNNIKAVAKPTQEKKEYACPRCSSQWTLMEVLDNPDPSGKGSGFLCKRCNAPLKARNQGPDAEPEADDAPARFNNQFKPLLDLLQQIDKAVVPAVTGEEAVANAKPVPRDEQINPAQKTEVVVDEMLRPTAVRGIQTGPDKVDITIQTDEQNTAAELAAEAERRAKIAAQNQLPVWHTQSTVAGSEGMSLKQNGVAGAADGATSLLAGNSAAATEDKKSSNADLDAYFEALKQEQDRKAKEEEEEEEEEDDEDEFEDVVTPSVAATPVPAAAPADGAAPDAKRIKLEEPATATALSLAPPAPAAAAPASSAQPSEAAESDEDDFEDVV
ncbi:uncharacterized protein K452DRAFT_257550 [Aplosporella prunicola CBS 121167]|uniref:HTH TFE/IIEalpha-type domain-containing protein n=1 Tax=Aplosporella prunicola CBS 121167 TaxID=1176127 RepID=A0A6A6AZZ1_9PEZI|nr:uncharacterized protein K452DRAFT_257550 [Aplosporella prunicola CBS 121167]KAF2137489.1 hypothetical protein K452DRAFT_257550 [Aplosporella prunicola CBS 121167]